MADTYLGVLISESLAEQAKLRVGDILSALTLEIATIEPTDPSDPNFANFPFTEEIMGGYVLENGRVLMSGPSEEFFADELIRTAYLGL